MPQKIYYTIMFQKFKYRSTEEEIMDDFNMRGEELERTLNVIENINQWLGGDLTLLSGIKKILPKLAKEKQQTITIFDAGCGSGDSLRAIAKWNKNRGYNLNLIGVDANEFTIDIAKEKAKNHTEIQFLTKDIFSDNCSFKGVDIVVCGLFMHHLTETEQLKFIKKCFRSDVPVILVNDLHRHWLGYYLFHLICLLFSVPHMVKHDGLLSILKAFKRSDLQKLMRKAGIKSYSLRWKWAFRFQLIAYN